LHLSTQVPNVYHFISDGPRRTYKYLNTRIEFINGMKREITGLHEITVVVIQALRTLGEENITEKEIQILSDELSNNDKKIILEETKFSTNWIYEIIKKICTQEG